MNRNTVARMAVFALALPLAAITAGCAGQRKTSTGFLQPSPYHSFLVEDVTFVPGPNAPENPNTRTLGDLKSVYAEALAQELAGKLERVERPGPGVLSVRAAITDYEPANVWLNVVTSTVIGPVTAGGASSEAELVDSVTGARVASLAASSTGTPFLGGPLNYFKRHGHARVALRRHAATLGERLGPVAGGGQ